MKWVLIGLLKAYRLVISPLYGDVCRYYPTCSAYALTAVQTHGAIKGTSLTMYRLARCNPWSRGGYDPVPGTPQAQEWAAEQAADATIDQAADARSADAETGTTGNDDAVRPANPRTRCVT